MKRSAARATPVEQMIVAAARMIPDGSVVMVGTQWPIPVSLLAKELHAPRAVICYEGGVVLGEVPSRIPLFTGDPASTSCSVSMGDSLDTLGMVLHGGRADLAMLSAASVDRFGNINTTCVGKYAAPARRFGGSGGACDFGSLAPRTIIILEHDRRRFPAEVDFITTPGYLQGGGGRESVGLRSHTGPSAVVTTLGVFHFDHEGEMVLATYHPSTTVDEVKANVQWDLQVDEKVRPTESPTAAELDVLRNKLDPEGMYLKNARFLEGKEFRI